MAIRNEIVLNTDTEIFLCPGNLPDNPQEHAVTCVIFCNTSGSAADLTVHVVKQSDPVSTTNKIISNLTIPAGETFTFDTEKLVLDTGDAVIALSTPTSALSATVSSVRVS